MEAERLGGRHRIRSGSPMAVETQAGRVVTIRPTKGWLPIRFRELWKYRELISLLIWREVRVRYKQTILGIAWVVLQPLLMTLVFTFIFASLVGISSGGVPYALFAYVALLPWNLFAKGLTDGSKSLSSNEPLVTKVYFPRLVLPVAAVFSGLVDFAIASLLLIPLMLYYRIVPTIALLTLPIFILIALVASVGIAAWLSAVDAKYRDVRYTLAFLTQLWFFATPIVYPLSSVPVAWRGIYSLNPMVGVVEGFRWAILGGSFTPDLLLMGVSVSVIVAIFFGGLIYFRRTERIFADIV